MAQRRDRRRGFTLVELMLVVVIIGILAGVVLPNLSGSSKKARMRAAQAQVKNFETAIDMFDLQMGRLPETLDELITDPGDPEWAGPYLKKKTLPKDPWKHDYVYNREGTNSLAGYDLYSMGPDGIDGTEDDIGNWDKADVGS